MSEKRKNLYSQLGEELIIREFFDDRRDGFYLDVGAAWGHRVSTTFYLDKELGWQGIGVDALEVYRKSWNEHRPGSRFRRYAVTDKTGEQLEFYHAKIPTLSSLYSEQIEVWKLKESQYNKVSVESIRLDDLLAQEGVDSLDFLSIDVEGAEPSVLAGFSIDRYRPELVCIEVNRAFETSEKILQYFSVNGYRRLEQFDAVDIANWYFARD